MNFYCSLDSFNLKFYMTFFLSLSFYFHILFWTMPILMCFTVEAYWYFNMLLVVCILSIEELRIIKGRKLQKFLRGSMFLRVCFILFYCSCVDPLGFSSYPTEVKSNSFMTFCLNELLMDKLFLLSLVFCLTQCMASA